MDLTVQVSNYIRVIYLLILSKKKKSEAKEVSPHPKIILSILATKH